MIPRSKNTRPVSPAMASKIAVSRAAHSET
jgi:hypothetical protein